VVAVKTGNVGPQADGTTPFQNPLDVRRHAFWLTANGKSGILRGAVPSVVAGQMQLSFTAGSVAVCERDGSNVELDRAYPVYWDTAAVVQFTTAHATLARIDALVAAVVDVEDGAQGSLALGVGGFLAVVAGTAAGSPVAPTDTEIKTALGRGGFHRLYNVPIAAASTQIALGGATFTGFKINDWTWNASGIAAAANWTLTSSQYILMGLTTVRLRATLTRTTSTVTATSQGNITDTAILTGIPAALRPIVDTAYGDFYVGPGISAGSWRIDTAGNASLTDMYPTAVIGIGDTVRLDIIYPTI
jgi:hypothetical protein